MKVRNALIKVLLFMDIRIVESWWEIFVLIWSGNSRTFPNIANGISFTMFYQYTNLSGFNDWHWNKIWHGTSGPLEHSAHVFLLKLHWKPLGWLPIKSDMTKQLCFIKWGCTLEIFHQVYRIMLFTDWAYIFNFGYKKHVAFQHFFSCCIIWDQILIFMFTTSP